MSGFCGGVYLRGFVDNEQIWVDSILAAFGGLVSRLLSFRMGDRRLKTSTETGSKGILEPLKRLDLIHLQALCKWQGSDAEISS